MPFKKVLPALLFCAVLGSASAGSARESNPNAPDRPVQHVLLISVDGLHQNDLDWFVTNHPDSALAKLVRTGISYMQAFTPFPSDSFPGMVGQVTGGNPKTTGIYYDDAFSRKLLPAGTTCENTTPGAEVQYAENIDKDPDRLDAGQGIPSLYANVPASFALISQLSSHPARDLIDPAQLPVDPRTCLPVYPHQYLKVNTIFEVAHAKGLRTAWSDKHPAYEILSGPSGLGIDEFFTPEINSSTTDPSLPAGPGPDFTKDNLSTQLYDRLKVAAVLNWIDGHDHAGNGHPGTPAIYGMNFQSVSTAQKLNKSSYRDPANPSAVLTGLGGYSVDASGRTVPGLVLQGALSFVDDQIGQMVEALDMGEAVVIVSAKHGQSPENRADLTIIDDGAMTDALNAAWATHKPSATLPLIAHAMDDDGVLLWLNERSEEATSFAADFLTNYSGTGIGSDAAGNKTSKPFTNAGLKTIYAGEQAAAFIGVARADARVPDLIGIAKQGSVYAGSKLSKIAEHGGNARQDRHVALVVSGGEIRHDVVTHPVATTQIAPTILNLLGLRPATLQAVRAEHTEALPGID